MVTVSIIVPCYHSERFIKKALDSFAAQTYQDFEVICVVDDWRHDVGPYLIDDHKIRDKVKLILHFGKSNPATARNEGIRAAKGKYIAFCDSDDYWEPDKLERQVNVMVAHPDLDLVYSKIEVQHQGNWNHTAGEEYTREHLLKTCCVPHSTTLVKRGLARTFPFNESMGAIDDYEWLLRLSDNKFERMHFIPLVLAHAVVHDSNLTNDNTKAYWDITKLHFSRGQYYIGLKKYITAMSIITLVNLKAKVFEKGSWRLKK